MTDSTSLCVYGSVIAYYTGKLEGYLRYKEIPYQLGEAPTLADFGFFAPMFRHFSQDPTAAELMQQRFDAEIEGVPYRRMPVSQYRVWCLEQLREHYQRLPADTAAGARDLLERHGCWQPLFEVASPDSRYDPDGQVPFRGRKVHYHSAR